MRFLTFAGCAALWLLSCASGLAADDVMRVHFIDVGQGNATLIEFPNGVILVDAGGEMADEFDGSKNLMKYLETFFARRTDLAGRDHPIDLLAITHPHIDHTVAIPRILDDYPPANVIHNHQRTGTGADQQILAMDYIRQTAAQGYFIVQDRAVDSVLQTGKGITNSVIDPIGPSTSVPTDPKVAVLWGGVRNGSGWNHSDLADENNHSLVIRVDFGEASLLFPGDLEEAGVEQDGSRGKAGIERMVEAYASTNVLDADVYLVGHHGSHNGGSNALLQLIKPEIAVISCGPPVKRRGGGFNAFNFGHPRKEAIEELEAVTTSVRTTAKDAKYFEKMQHPLDKHIEKGIYCTGWDGTIVLEGTSAGAWKVVELVGNPAFP